MKKTFISLKQWGTQLQLKRTLEVKYKGRFGDHLVASSHWVLREWSLWRLVALRQGLAYLFIFQGAGGALKFSWLHVMSTALVVGANELKLWVYTYLLCNLGFLWRLCPLDKLQLLLKLFMTRQGKVESRTSNTEHSTCYVRPFPIFTGRLTQWSLFPHTRCTLRHLA